MRIFKTLLFILIAQPAFALAPWNGQFEYSLKWNGIPFGEAVIEMHQTAKTYASSAHVKLSGLAKLVARHESDTKVEGVLATNLAQAKRRYTSAYTHKKIAKSIDLHYAAGGALAEGEVLPKEDPNWRPPVAPAQLKAIPDPLTYVFMLRDAVAKKRDKSEFTQAMFDGKRLTRTQVSILGEEEVDGAPAIKALITRTPLAGYTKKELKKLEERGAEPITVWFADDEEFYILKIAMKTRIGEVTAEL